VISSFRRDVGENCALLGHYAASSCNLLPTFRDNPSVPYSRVKNPRRSLYRRRNFNNHTGRGTVHSLIIYTSFRRNNIIILSVASHLPSKCVGLSAKEIESESNSCDMFLVRVMTSTGYVSRVHVTLSLFAEVMSFVSSDCCQVQLLCTDINVWTAIYLLRLSHVSADVRVFECSLQNASVLWSESFEK